MRKVIILGATGSIGTTAIKAIVEKKLPIKVMGLVAHSNKEKIEEISSGLNAPYILMKGRDKTELFSFIKNIDADIVLNGISGAFGLYATLCALDCDMDVALANKESIVMGGGFLLSYAKKLNRKLIPVDSEHSAIYNLMKNQENVSKLIITASGGPFLNKTDLKDVTVEDAVKHPTWKMGKKISIDSATLANKGLEVIEAGFLFDFSSKDIDVVIHRQSIIHSMIQKKDGSIYAQLSPPDMTLPIISAISDNNFTLPDIVSPLDFSSLNLTFSSWNKKQFPLLSLAYEALEKKKGYPIAFNAANEIAVEAFIEGRIPYLLIQEVVLKVMTNSFETEAKNYDEILEIDSKARRLALDIIDAS